MVLEVSVPGGRLTSRLTGICSKCMLIRIVTEADVMRSKTSVEMTQDLINDKHCKIDQIEGRIREKVSSKF